VVIWLSNDCYIKADDGVCFELMKRYKRKKGDNAGVWTQKALGYYGTLEQALHGALNKAILNKKAEGDTREMLAAIQAIATRITEAAMGVVTASQAANIEASFTHEEIENLLFFEDDQ
jgi:hypothetical protein